MAYVYYCDNCDTMPRSTPGTCPICGRPLTAHED